MCTVFSVGSAMKTSAKHSTVEGGTGKHRLDACVVVTSMIKSCVGADLGYGFTVYYLICIKNVVGWRIVNARYGGQYSMYIDSRESITEKLP